MKLSDTFNFEQSMIPVWSGDTVYDESIMFFPEPVTGAVHDAPLLYKPEEILAVRSFDLQTVYEEGVDYEVVDGRIRRLPDSRIPVGKFEDMYPSEQPTNWIARHRRMPGRYFHILDWLGYPFQQAVVTYTHKDVWQGPVPAFAGDKLPLTYEKLVNRQKLSIIIYGDSISVGHNSSKLHGCKPYTPTFFELFADRLREAYQSYGIQALNTSESGMDSAFAAAHAEERVTAHKPDLCIIGWGMNGSTEESLKRYEADIRAVIDAARRGNPNAEIILLSSHLPNEDCIGYGENVRKYEKILRNMAETMPGVALADMTEMHDYLLTRKRYMDMTGNGVNHPNDFLIRIHAQYLAGLLVR